MGSLGIFGQSCDSFIQMCSDLTIDKAHTNYIITKLSTIIIPTIYYIFSMHKKPYTNPDLRSTNSLLSTFNFSFRPTSLNHLAATWWTRTHEQQQLKTIAAMEERGISYFKELDKEHAKRYLLKIYVIQSTDPYCLERVDIAKDVLLFPSVTYPDIVNRFSTQKKCYDEASIALTKLQISALEVFLLITARP